MTIMQLLIVVTYSTLYIMVFLLCLINTTPVSHNAIKRSYETWYWYKVYGY